MKKNLFLRVYQVVSKIPQGKVMTYGEVASVIGSKNLARLVGTALHKNPNQANIPCHRVVNRRGEVAQGFAFGGAVEQIKRLKEEGVLFSNGRVDLEKCRFNQIHE